MDSMITMVAPIRRGDVAALNAMIDALGNPCCSRVRDALDRVDPDGGGTHFLSLHAIVSAGDGDAHIVFEITADGDAKAAIGRIVAAIGADLLPIFSMARDWRDNVGLAAYLDNHRIEVGSSYSDPPGLCFAGTPHMSVKRIRDEAALAGFVASVIDNGGCDVRPIDRLAQARDAVAADEKYQWSLAPPPPPGRGERSGSPIGLVAELAGPFIRAYLWPFAFVLAAALAVAAVLIRPYAEDNALLMLWGWAQVLAVGFGATLAVLLAVALILYLKLREQEKNDWLDTRAPDLATLAEIRRRENHGVQNHMVSITERKPGFVRFLTLRLAFWIIAMFATRVYREGFLGGISTIHAARWITIPGTRTLVFFSNFGGSWESYLEDFITRAHEGLTAVWSNSIGFPRAKNLFQDGATDGERFKRYARASMQPTLFWYSAYPDLTTDNVRCNAALRRGLASALTNDEAKQWLALFGSGARPDSKLETSEIQSLVFGGLGFMKEGSVVLYNLPDDREKARAFMRGIYPDIGFGDGRKLRHDAIVTVALGPRALEKLGLPDDCLKGFAAAFLEGMSIEGRNRILGDIGKNAPKHWLWGRDPFDLALLVYGRDETSVGELCKRLAALAKENDLGEPHRIPLIATKKPAIEPFGFVDGISQPIIRGSYQSFRKNDPIHLVEPGEFIIGYPDNRNNFPPEPELSCLADPDNRLPVADKSCEFGNTIVEAPRAVGRNGTYLVIRQLEQDVGGFWQYCRREARRLAHRLPAPYDMRPAYIAAKLVGRWRDGSSLVRNPYYPFPTEHKERAKRRANRENAPGYDEVTAVAASGEPVGSETVRPDSNPPDGAAIAAPPLSGAAATAAAATPAVTGGAGAALRATGAKQKSEAADPAASEAAAEKAAEKKGEPPPEEKSPVRYSDNDFLFGVEDPEALRCPFGAHIRRANPRDSLSPGSMDQVSISNRHRMLRVGRLYKPEPGRDPGLLFMCLNGDIERQFEFIQQTWLVSPTFHGLAGEQDPLTSNCEGTGFVVPSFDGPVRLEPLPQFVTTLGGGYFFMPGRALLAYLGEV
jgi:deferrochelatase/peroxidase EfeB